MDLRPELLVAQLTWKKLFSKLYKDGILFGFPTNHLKQNFLPHYKII